MDIAVPKGASIEAHGRYGDFDITGVSGNISIESDNAGVRLSDIGGSVSVETRRSDIVRVVGVKGNVELRGAGWDIELDTIQGLATVNGTYTGDKLFRRLAQPLRYDTPTTELRVERTPGQISISRGDFTASGLAGPFLLKTRSTDVELYDFQGPAEVNLEHGDIEIRPAAALGGKFDLRTRAGDIRLSLPETAQFDLRAETRRGEIDNEWNGSARVTEEGRRRTIALQVGTGPVVNAVTDRGSVVLRKGSASEPPPPPKPPKAPSRRRSKVRWRSCRGQAHFPPARGDRLHAK
ncbi:MAG: DUF4097 family beta strand repeat-containing protein [Bryobacteraceae bacterium]